VTAHDVTIETMLAGDWPAVSRIYQAGIDGGDATFETAPPSWQDFDTARLPAPRFVARIAGAVVGWVAVAPVSPRQVYAGVVEHSVFVDPAYQGRGIGNRLLATLVQATEAAGIWTIQAHVFPENLGSLRLHERHGFRQVGVRRRLGQVRAGSEVGRWRDVVLIERRSQSTGR
jgi:L-amino acid N-acyltransferase YncA